MPSNRTTGAIALLCPTKLNKVWRLIDNGAEEQTADMVGRGMSASVHKA
eukprot:COSAG05_NODE_808_length_7189_cov_16.336530_5_plen_49_part_00